MNGKQYNSVIDWTLQQEQSEDTLTTARAVCNNLGVALPEGDLPQVAATLKSNDYMGWRSCTMQEAQAAADSGAAAIGVSDQRIVVLAAADEEQPIEEGVSVMALSEGTSAYAVDGLRYYAYGSRSISTTYRPWEYYANQIISYANSFLEMTEAQVENATGASLSDRAWCVDFVRLCCKLAGVYDTNYTDIIPTTSGSTAMRNWFRDNYPTRFHEGIEGIQPGDIVFIENTDNPSGAEHTCIAIATADDNNRINTINGNWGGCVKRQKFPYTQSGVTKRIKWFVHPDYTKANSR